MPQQKNRDAFYSTTATMESTAADSEMHGLGGHGSLCVLEGGVLKSYGLDDPAHIAKAARGELSFVQISDSHMGFNKPATPT